MVKGGSGKEGAGGRGCNFCHPTVAMGQARLIRMKYLELVRSSSEPIVTRAAALMLLTNLPFPQSGGLYVCCQMLLVRRQKNCGWQLGELSLNERESRCGH